MILEIIHDSLFKLLPESWLITGWVIYSDSISDVKYSCIRNFINRKNKDFEKFINMFHEIMKGVDRIGN